MTTNNHAPAANRATVADIDAVDSFAKQLYRRARTAGVDFAEVATVVRGVHTVLKHLKVEAEDPGSLLNTDQSPVYARQLTPIVEDCDFTLKQLDTILQRFGANTSNGGGEQDGRNGASAQQQPLEARDRDMIAFIRTRLENEKLNIDIFLDTVQLHNPSKSYRVVETSSENLEFIKDKVDAIAARITQRRDSALGEDDDELWLQFRDELEKEGFSKDVLRNNQDVLRAYIRQLDERRMLSGGHTPTVRGFLEEYKSSAPQPSIPYPTYPEDNGSPKEMLPSPSNEKFSPSIKNGRLPPDQYPPYPSSLPRQTATSLSYEPHSEEDGDDGTTDHSMALVISTRELMASDKKQADLAYAMDNLHLQLPPPGYGPSYPNDSNLSTSPHSRYLEVPSSTGVLTSPHFPSVDEYGMSPRFVPSFPPPPYGTSPPPTLHSNSISAPTILGSAPAMPIAQGQPQRYARLAPDSLGHEIPLDAQWTRIKRSLISPEVLNKAGVRYEARPDFVAILGVFTREQVAEFARQSLEVRKRRQEQHKRSHRDDKDRYYPGKYQNWEAEEQRKKEHDNTGRGRANSEFSSSSTELWDTSDDESDDEAPRGSRGRHYHGDDRSDGLDDEKGTKVYPFIVPPPDKDKENGHSPSATVKPKPILKNKDDDPHVRFDPEPKVLDNGSPRSVPRHAERSERRQRSASDRDRYAPRSADDRGDRYRERERDREKDDDYRRHQRHHDSSRRKERHRDDYSRRRHRDDIHRDRDRYRDDADRSEDRTIKKRVRGETLRAVGIGGAAASLLSVLTEAAAGF